MRIGVVVVMFEGAGLSAWSSTARRMGDRVLMHDLEII